MPESFRGGCSFGGPIETDLSPIWRKNRDHTIPRGHAFGPKADISRADRGEPVG